MTNNQPIDVVVTGIGLASALGNLETSWQRLLSGESGLQLRQPFPELPRLPLAMLDEFPSDFLKLVERVVTAALQDAGLTPPLPDCGVVIGSSRAQQGKLEQLSREDKSSPHHNRYGRIAVCPDSTSDWLHSLPHMGAIAAARQIGSTGAVLAPMAACATGIWAIAQGFELIQTGQCQRAIVGAVETPITPLTLAGFDRMGALAKTGSYPFDRRREGLALGEGAAILVLESVESARRRHAPIYGRILGFGVTADAHHICATEPGGKSAKVAVKQCLDRSGLSAEDIGYIHAHGTSTQLNDRSEARLIQSLFPQGVPVSSTKGATGHTLGASGALGAVFSLLALKHQILPPCVGLKEPEFDLDFVTSTRSASLRHALCFSFGFGGQNAVLAFGC
ncbi:MAG: beta-ketoacyl-ACP synthase [Geitlerinemataceae cyanobacterium]